MSKAANAARDAAKRASVVFSAVLNAPKAPAPAAFGVDVAEFRYALPWFTWRELGTFANLFGQRRNVREVVAASLAEELHRRLTAAASAIAGSGDGARLQPKDVASVIYSFSKIEPQSPEYRPLYDGVARGIEQGLWDFSRMQAALVGTAFAEVGVHLTDALPAVLQSALDELQSEEAQAQVNLDELRYLLHACAALPDAALQPHELIVLSSCTLRLAGQANFALGVHLLVSWLHIKPPPGTKKNHQDVLRAICEQLRSQTPQNPAHPLPAGGLAPAIVDLVGRERERSPPPLTPPLFRCLIFALQSVSRGLRSDPSGRGRGRKSLGVGDWTNIAWVIVQFCEAHQELGSLEEAIPGQTRTLPAWATDAVSFVFQRAQYPTPDGPAPADLDTVLSLLRLLRRYQLRQQPGRPFFTWAQHRVVEAYESGNAEPAALAEAVSELVPRLPEEERLRFAQILVVSPQASLQTTLRPNLLAQARLAAAEEGGHGRLLRPATQAKLSAPAGVRLARPSAAHAQAANPKEGLWGLLANGPAPAAERKEKPVIEVESEVLGESRQEVPNQEVAAVQLVDDSSALQSEEANGTPEEVGKRELAAEDSRALQERLERALERVEALEVRLEESEKRRADGPASAADLSPSGGTCWETPALPSSPGLDVVTGAGVGTPFPVGPGPSVYLRRAFNFEEFRRSESRRLKSERLRMVISPDHVPMWQLKKKH